MIGLLGLAALVCGGASQLAPTRTQPVGLEVGGQDPRLRVLTQNFYVGADLDAVALALRSPDPGDDLPAVETAVHTLMATDVAARARAIAAELARTRPHVVGLQEMSVIDLDLTSIGRPVVMHVDFVTELERALRSRGLPYEIAARNRNFTVSPLPGVSLTDEDLLLVDPRRTTVLASFHGTFGATLGRVAAGVELHRGWAGARIRLGGETFVVVTVHPESNLGSQPLGRLRTAQIRELVDRLGPFGRTVLMGDLNDEPDSPMIQVLRDAGYLDVWAWLERDPGYTCCHPADLADETPRMTSRIDYIFVRGFGDPARIRGSIELLGTRPQDRIEGPFHPIWPSDHAGLYAELWPAAGAPGGR